MLEFRVVENWLGQRGRFGRQLPAPPDTPVFQTALGWSCSLGTGTGAHYALLAYPWGCSIHLTVPYVWKLQD